MPLPFSREAELHDCELADRSAARLLVALTVPPALDQEEPAGSALRGAERYPGAGAQPLRKEVFSL